MPEHLQPSDNNKGFIALMTNSQSRLIRSEMVSTRLSPTRTSSAVRRSPNHVRDTFEPRANRDKDILSANLFEVRNLSNPAGPRRQNQVSYVLNTFDLSNDVRERHAINLRASILHAVVRGEKNALQPAVARFALLTNGQALEVLVVELKVAVDKEEDTARA